MSDELKPTNGKKLSDSVAQLIKEEIITNRIPPGERLFDEKDFLKTYKVSKGTMREALKSLEVQGLVNIRTGPGGGPLFQESVQKKPMNCFGIIFSIEMFLLRIFMPSEKSLSPNWPPLSQDI